MRQTRQTKNRSSVTYLFLFAQQIETKPRYAGNNFCGKQSKVNTDEEQKNGQLR